MSVESEKKQQKKKSNKNIFTQKPKIPRIDRDV